MRSSARLDQEEPWQFVFTNAMSQSPIGMESRYSLAGAGPRKSWIGDKMSRSLHAAI